MLERFLVLVRINSLNQFCKNIAILKFSGRIFGFMISKIELDQVLKFVSNRWLEISKDPNNIALKNLPSNFWMNSIGGKAGKGRWVTMLMYTENEGDANAFKEVLLRWQSKGTENKKSRDIHGPDLIQISKSRN